VRIRADNGGHLPKLPLVLAGGAKHEGPMRRFILCILVLGSASAAGATQPYERFRISDAEFQRVTSAEYRRCMDTSGGVTSNMRDCSETESLRLDARLNAVYRDAMSRLPTPAARNRLRALERRWVATRYRDCERNARSERGGTLWLIMMDGCGLDEDVRRIAWLERYERRP
jgi:uncharacterized protein YecT (DUF1311 family)